MSTPGMIDIGLYIFLAFCGIVFIIAEIYEMITGQELTKRGDSSYHNHHFDFDSRTINPASGLPMRGSTDVAGNAYGEDSISNFHGYK